MYERRFMPKIIALKHKQKAIRPTSEKFKPEKLPKGRVSVTLGLLPKDVQDLQDLFPDMKIGGIIGMIATTFVERLRERKDGENGN
jgi:hypothetical protein